MSNSVLLKIIASLLLLLAAAIALYVAYSPPTNSTQNTAIATAGTIGGPFSLQTGDGKTITDTSFPSKLKLLYFGYTFCPDVCPTGLLNISAALDALPSAQAAQIQPLFVTIDPKRDTPDIVSEYASYYDKRIIGLSGSQQDIDNIINGYRVYVSIPDHDADDTYLVDHSSYIYLMGKDGQFLAVFPHTISPDEMANKLKDFLK